MIKNEWWGYRHVNGTLHVKRFFSDQDIHEADESPFVDWATGPFQAANREEALAKLKDRT